MAKSEKFLTATHPERGKLWAAIDDSAHHLEGKVEERRFTAFLSPFRSRDEAQVALEAAGAQLDKVS